MSRLLEVCVDNYESALAAIQGGAKRLELCSSLSDGGLTPTPGLLKQIQAANCQNIDIFCMLRCRSSTFTYTQEELNIMLNDASLLKQHGANGFVFGALLDNGHLDMKKCREIIKICYPLPVTFHRAFDICHHPFIQLESIIDLGFARLLTSGQKKTATEGVDMIKQLIKRSKDRLVIMPGSGIQKENLKFLIDETDAVEYHGSFKITNGSQSDANSSNIDFGSLTITDTNMVAEIVQMLKTI